MSPELSLQLDWFLWSGVVCLCAFDSLVWFEVLQEICAAAIPVSFQIFFFFFDESHLGHWVYEPRAYGFIAYMLQNKDIKNSLSGNHFRGRNFDFNFHSKFIQSIKMSWVFPMCLAPIGSGDRNEPNDSLLSRCFGFDGSERSWWSQINM